MSRWSTRFRRAASALLGVHLLQVVLLAASAVCDLSYASAAHAAAAAAASPVAIVSPSADAHGSHSMHHGAVPSSDETPAPHHTSHTTSCPMAMACAVTAIVVPIPAIATHEVRIDTERIAHDTRMLHSMRQAPEPPPPRG